MSVTVSTLSAHGDATQPLYSLTTNQFGKVVPVSEGSAVTITFPNTDVTTGANISLNTNGTITLNGGITYSLSARADVINAAFTKDSPPMLQWYLAIAGTEVGEPIPLSSGTPIHFTASMPNSYLKAKVVAPNGGTWAYPAELTNAFLTIEAISGYTV